MDKIFVNNYIKEIEIGAFQSERGCTQRVQFNVCLEIKPMSVELDDNVDRVLSYEIITEAINYELQRQRFNLLETLAENIAERCLSEKDVTRADVKIEKLDRIPGSLGISISRVRGPNIVARAKVNSKIWNKNISLVSFSAINIESEIMKHWVLTLIETNFPKVIIIEPFFKFLDDSFELSIKNQVDMLAMDQNALIVSTFDGRLSLASTRAEIEGALKLKRTVLFCPSEFVKKSPPAVPKFNKNCRGFACWLARKMDIKNLVIVGPDMKKEKFKDEELDIMHFNNEDWGSFK